MVIVPIHLFVPHGKGTDPQVTFSIECPIDNHRLFCFGMACNADDFIFHAFKMAVFAGLKFHKKLLKKKWAGKSRPTDVKFYWGTLPRWLFSRDAALKYCA